MPNAGPTLVAVRINRPRFGPDRTLRERLERMKTWPKR